MVRMEMKATNVKVLIAILFLVGLGVGYPIGRFTTPTKVIEKEVEVPTPALEGDIFIGFIISEMPEDRIPMAEIAIEDVNEYVKKMGVPVTFKILFEDTEGSAVKASEKLGSIAARGVELVTGFTWSSHIKACKEYADENKIIILSTGSTSPALVIPDDYVFRMVCDDRVQGKAVARMHIDYGIKAIVVMQRADSWGDGLYGEFKKWFEEWGGVIIDYVRYDPEKKEFGPEVSIVASKISDAIEEYGKDKVAIQVFCFSPDGVPIQITAADYPILLEIPWFGSDGHAGSTRLLDEAGEFAAKTHHISTVMGLTEQSTLEMVREKFKEKTGRVATFYDITVYDAIWILAKAVLEADSYDGEVIKNILPEVAAAYYGATGWCKFNDAGDRAAFNYDVFAVVEEEGVIDWKLVGVYDFLTGKITWIAKP